MIALDSSTIARVVDGQLVGSGRHEVGRVVIDSRSAARGDCFVAIVGPRDDGHRYLADAIAAGARVFIVQREDILEHLPCRQELAVIVVSDTTQALQALAAEVRRRVAPLVIAITGSVGKTTTKTLTHALLRDTAATHATPGNFNNHWGLPLSLLGLENDDRWMVAELGMSAAGEIAALARLARPAIGVITNVAPVHMENFAGIEAVAAAKAELADELGDDGTLVVNGDDPRTVAIGERTLRRGVRVLTFGEASENSVRASSVHSSGRGWAFELRTPSDHSAVELPLPGRYSILNFLAAAAVAHALGITATTIAARAQGLGLPAMRGQVHETATGITVIDDSYNASPAAMMRAIDTLCGIARGRRVLVAGGMLELGSWSEDAHREVGLHAAQEGVDLVVSVGSLARDISRGARAGGMAAESVREYTDSSDAARAITQLVRSGDTVLVKGSRGVRTERITQALLAPAADGGAP